VMKLIHKAVPLFIQIKFRFFTISVRTFSRWSDFHLFLDTQRKICSSKRRLKLCHSNRYSNSVISDGNFSLHCQILKSSLNDSNWNGRPTQWPCERSGKKTVFCPYIVHCPELESLQSCDLFSLLCIQSFNLE
jgi:hypothetical protein